MEKYKNIVVFDLDDTLYQEIDYKRSGILEVCKWIEKLYGIKISSSYLDEILDPNKKGSDEDILAILCDLAGLPYSIKESLLWIYRLHSPSIVLRPDVKKFINKLKDNSKFIILTDGRSVSQRLKMFSLGLSDLPAYISEEQGASKPSELSFRRIMSKHSGERYIYIGDNPVKDFIAPNNLGWITIGLKDSGTNIHKQSINSQDMLVLPLIWVINFDQALDVIC